jgi:hypothetical protein
MLDQQLVRLCAEHAHEPNRHVPMMPAAGRMAKPSCCPEPERKRSSYGLSRCGCWWCGQAREGPLQRRAGSYQVTRQRWDGGVIRERPTCR